MKGEKNPKRLFWVRTDEQLNRPLVLTSKYESIFRSLKDEHSGFHVHQKPHRRICQLHVRAQPQTLLLPSSLRGETPRHNSAGKTPRGCGAGRTVNTMRRSATKEDGFRFAHLFTL